MSKSGEAGVRVVDGPRYDWEKVYVTYVALIDALHVANGGVSQVGIRGGDVRHDWPRPGKASTSTVWGRMREFYDVVRQPIHHYFGELTVHAYLLGTTWVERDPATGAVTLPTGRPISELDPAPWIRVSGFEALPGEPGPTVDLGGGAYARLPENYPTADEVARLEAVIRGPLADAGLVFQKEDGRPIGDDSAPRKAQFGSVTFPHAVYGAGYGPLRVRCVDVGSKRSAPAQE